MSKFTFFINMTIKNRLNEYIKASKKQKGIILTELQHATHRSRKSLIRTLNRMKKQSSCSPRTKRKGRPARYNSHTKHIIKLIWDANDNICAERLIGQIAETIIELQSLHRLAYYSAKDIDIVRSIPLGTLKYQLRSIASTHEHYGARVGKRKRRNIPQQQIPIRTRFDKDSNAGYFALDFVDHCGESSHGRFVRTLQFVDPKTTWICRRAAIGKDKQATTVVFDRVLRILPYPVNGLHSDNEPNLLESTLGQKARNANIFVTRTRSYMSKDNGHVEQKNGDKVRLLIGYGRYDTVEQLNIINRIYQIDDLYQNHFIPSVRVLGKVYNHLGKLIKREYSAPLTAYERVMAEPSIAESYKEKLQERHKTLNRVSLREKRDKLLRELYKIT